MSVVGWEFGVVEFVSVILESKFYYNIIINYSKPIINNIVGIRVSWSLGNGGRGYMSPTCQILAPTSLDLSLV